MTNKTRIATLFAACIMITGLAYYALVTLGQDQVTSGALLQPNEPQIVELGEQVYAANCGSCHGINLEGQVEDWRSPDANDKMPAPPHDKTGHTWHHTDELLFNITKFGLAKTANLKNYETDMPIYESTLSDEEIIAVLSFIKSKWPEEIRLRHDQLNENAK